MCAFDGASRLAGVQNPQGERTTYAADAVGRAAPVRNSQDATTRLASVSHTEAREAGHTPPLLP